jgi:NAD(P)-dependent dehydrogenase (short-subunit alcohol dehydrogenase family)
MTSNDRFAGRTILVTGATSGMGRATARALGAEGANVAAAGRRKERLAELSAEFKKLGRELLVLEGDVRDEATCARWVSETLARFGALHGLVNAAGVLGPGGAADTPTAEWDRIMDTNLRSVFLLTRVAAPELVKTKGSVVNLSSVGGLRPYPNLAAYCVSKAAVDQLTRCTALDLAPQGVRVNAVNPGVVVTELHTVTKAVADYPAFLEKGKTTHPIGRVGNAEEVASLILFLMSDEAGWITGVTYSIDGGRALSSAR